MRVNDQVLLQVITFRLHGVWPGWGMQLSPSYLTAVLISNIYLTSEYPILIIVHIHWNLLTTLVLGSITGIRFIAE